MATIATLVVDIAANQAQLIRDVDKIGSKLDSIGGMATKLAGAFGLAFSVDAAISFGQALMDDADALVRMSDQTGISIEGLNRLQAAADDAGNGIDQITAAVTKMEDKVASGDLAAGNALKAIGLSIEDIRKLSPDQQFIAISEGLRQIENPAEQVRIATDLFGKTGAQVLPTLKRGFDDLKDSAVGMSEETARALDDAGDTLTRWSRTFKGVAADALVWAGRMAQAGFNPATAAMQDMQRTAEQAAESAKKLTEKLAGPELAKGAAAIAPSMEAVDRAIKQAEKDQRALEQAQREAKRASEQAEAQARREAAARTINAEALTKEIRLLKLRAGGTQLTEVLPELDPARGLSKIGKLVSQPLEDAIGPSFAQRFGARLPNVIQSAFQGGGNVLKSIGSAFGGDLGKAIVGTGTNGLGGFLTGALGKTFGGALSAMIPGLGSVLGALGTKLIGKIFSNPEKQVNPIRQAFIDAGGGLAVMNQKAAEAGVTMRAVLDARTPEAYKKAIDDLNAAFDFQDNAMKTLDETVKRYGFTIDELGPAMQRQALDKQAQQLYQDFKVLTSAGLSVDTVLGKMGGSIQDFVTQSLRTGTEIPIAMKPMLQAMVESGSLLDANGNAITNLEDSGVSFAMTMSEGFQSLLKSVDKLTQAIARGLGVALESLPTETNLDVNINYNENNRPGGIADPLRDINLTPMADGGIGRVTRPTLFLAGEAGAEDFAFSGGGRSFRSSSGGTTIDTSALRDEIAQMREQQASLTNYMTGMFRIDLARATRDEVQKVAWRKRY